MLAQTYPLLITFDVRLGLFLLRPRLPYNAICELDYRSFFV